MVRTLLETRLSARKLLEETLSVETPLEKKWLLGELSEETLLKNKLLAGKLLEETSLVSKFVGIDVVGGGIFGDDVVGKRGLW